MLIGQYLARPADIGSHIAALEALLATRPRARRLDADAPRDALLAALDRILEDPETPQEHP